MNIRNRIDITNMYTMTGFNKTRVNIHVQCGKIVYKIYMYIYVLHNILTKYLTNWKMDETVCVHVMRGHYINPPMTFNSKRSKVMWYIYTRQNAAKITCLVVVVIVVHWIPKNGDLLSIYVLMLSKVAQWCSSQIPYRNVNNHLYENAKHDVFPMMWKTVYILRSASEFPWRFSF